MEIIIASLSYQALAHPTYCTQAHDQDVKNWQGPNSAK